MKNFMQKNLSNAPKVVKQPARREFAGASRQAGGECDLRDRQSSQLAFWHVESKASQWRMRSIQPEHSHRVAAEHFFFVHFG
jgi:hypothetical protein